MEEDDLAVWRGWGERARTRFNHIDRAMTGLIQLSDHLKSDEPVLSAQVAALCAELERIFTSPSPGPAHDDERREEA